MGILEYRLRSSIPSLQIPLSNASSAASLLHAGLSRRYPDLEVCPTTAPARLPRVDLHHEIRNLLAALHQHLVSRLDGNVHHISRGQRHPIAAADGWPADLVWRGGLRII